MLSIYQFVQLAWWIGLSTWFGSVLFVALAAPVIFRTIREANPLLPTVLSVNLENQHGTLLAGTIVANLLALLGKVEMICAGLLVLCFAAQFFVIDLSGSNLTAALIRGVLLLAVAAIAIFDRMIVWPSVQKYRAEYLENADDPEIANPAKERFDREHQRSVTMLSAMLFLLLGVVLFSANITPSAHYSPAAEVAE